VIWAGIATYSCLMAILASGGARLHLLMIAAGYCAVQALKMHPFEADRPALFFMAWAVIFGMIVATFDDGAPRQSLAIATLTLVAALCYPVGAALGQSSYIDGPRILSHLFWADAALIAAISVGGWHGLVMVFRDIGATRLDRWNG